jgi:hypothetical protein
MRLQQIEENYQKYAFFYTKYLEDQVLLKERDTQSNNLTHSLLSLLLTAKPHCPLDVQATLRTTLSSLPLDNHQHILSQLMTQQ